MTLTHAQPRPAETKAIPPVRFATLLVHAEPGMQASQRVEFAGRMARELDAHLIGLCAETLAPYMVKDEAWTVAPDERLTTLMALLEDDLARADIAFRRDSAGANVEVRRVVDHPATAMARISRAADLIIASPKTGAPSAREADPGGVVVACGKPVLIVPPHARRLRLETIVIAWKESRECRRALAAALPFLLRAARVVVQAVCDEASRLERQAEVDDVAGALKRQGVKAEARVVLSADGVVNALMHTLSEVDADLLVMGAYGHMRVAELVFGGVTEHFLRKPACCVLMTH